MALILSWYKLLVSNEFRMKLDSKLINFCNGYLVFNQIFLEIFRENNVSMRRLNVLNRLINLLLFLLYTYIIHFIIYILCFIYIYLFKPFLLESIDDFSSFNNWNFWNSVTISRAYYSKPDFCYLLSCIFSLCLVPIHFYFYFVIISYRFFYTFRLWFHVKLIVSFHTNSCFLHSGFSYYASSFFVTPFRNWIVMQWRFMRFDYVARVCASWIFDETIWILLGDWLS